MTEGHRRTDRAVRTLRRHWAALTGLLVGVAIPMVGLALLAEDVWNHEGFFFDRPTLEWLHARATPAFDQVMLWASRLGYPWGLVPLAVLVAGLLLINRQVRRAVFLAVAAIGASALTTLGKLLFHRQRPHLWKSLAPEVSYSFPSGHATISMAVIAALIFLSWRTRWRWVVVVLGVPAVLLVGASRVYLGVHYPSDILAGWAVSVAWVTGSYFVIQRGHDRR